MDGNAPTDRETSRCCRGSARSSRRAPRKRCLPQHTSTASSPSTEPSRGDGNERTSSYGVTGQHGATAGARACAWLPWCVDPASVSRLGGMDTATLPRSGSRSAVVTGSWRTFERIPRGRARRDEGGARARNQLPRRRPLQRRDGQRADPHGLLRGALRRAVPRGGLAARRDRRSQQALVGVLAGGERRRGARRLARPHGPGPDRPDLRQPAAGRAAGRLRWCTTWRGCSRPARPARGGS